MKVGLLTSGGDCQGLNPTLRAVAKALYNLVPDVSIYGVLDGYAGLIEDRIRRMQPADFEDIIRLGGTILGTSRQSFKSMFADDGQLAPKAEQMLANYRARGFDALVILGGNGSQKTANLLREQGVRVVFLPKTIDNDISGTDLTFGFDSAVARATDVLDAIQTTARAHGRVFVVELMGQKTGWLAVHAGISAAADVILIPEIPYFPQRVYELITARNATGTSAVVIAVAEGALSDDERMLTKEQRVELTGTAGVRLADWLKQQLASGGSSQEVKLVVPGYYQRGGTPTATDRLLCSRLGVKAAEMVAKHQFGCMAAEIGTEIVAVPLAAVTGKLKLLDANDSLIRAARQLGIVFGD
ncbi:MAG: 6-phosphofructokinase [Coriobacteriales bacterium]|jgi:6-phosphofructokinase 1|nr:6-phosphofructokinase [Coriobacteriales bacterium]